MKAWFSMHRWLGWLLAPVLAVSAATGAFLVWQQPLPSLPQDAPPVAALASAIDRGLMELQASHPDLKPGYIDLPREAGQAVRVRMLAPDGRAGESWAELDPASGALLSLLADDVSLVAWISGLHYELLLDEGGTWVLGGVALLTLVTLVIAWRLWIRVRRFRAPTAWRRWHRRIGVVMLLPMLVTLITGFLLSWPQVIRAPLTWATGQPRLTPPPAPRVDALTQPISAGQALLSGVAHFPGAVPTRLYAPAAGSFRLRLRTDEWHPNGLNNVYVGLHDGTVLKVVAWRDLPWSMRYSNVVYPLHIAWMPGQASPVAAVLARVLWTATALAMLALVVSGLPWRRWLHRSSAPARPNA